MNVGDTMCTSEKYREYIGGGCEYIMSTLGDVQYIRGIS